MSRNWLFTNQSVSEGHPDKVCDRVSDAILNALLAADPEARCGAETLDTTNHITIAGEVRGQSRVLKDVPDIARRGS